MFFGKKDKVEKPNVIENDSESQNDFLSFPNGCFNGKPLLTEKNKEIATYFYNELKTEFLSFYKVRLLEFLNPMGDLEEKKRLLVEVQNLTADIIIVDENGNVAVVVLFEPESLTAFYEKKLSYTKRICELVGVSFTVINDVIDIETNGVISQYLKED